LEQRQNRSEQPFNRDVLLSYVTSKSVDTNSATQIEKGKAVYAGYKELIYYFLCKMQVISEEDVKKFLDAVKIGDTLLSNLLLAQMLIQMGIPAPIANVLAPLLAKAFTQFVLTAPNVLAKEICKFIRQILGLPPLPPLPA
jgi:hypothetical protein